MIWIGLAHVIPKAGNGLLEGAHGAVVPVVGLARNEGEFASRVATLLVARGFAVPEVFDIEQIEERQKRHVVESDIALLTTTINKQNRFAFGTFETYSRPS